jgi:WD40 repeat protein
MKTYSVVRFCLVTSCLAGCLVGAITARATAQAEAVAAPQTVAQVPLQLDTQIGHNRTLSTMAYSPVAPILATGSYDQTIRLWDTRSGALLRILVGHTAGVTQIVFTPDGRTLASVAAITSSMHADNTVRLWDVETGAEKRVTKCSWVVASVAISPGGNLLAAGGGDKKIHVWKLQDGELGELITTLSGHTSFPDSLAFSPDGSLLASGGGGGDNNVKLWDVKTWQLKNTLTGHTAKVASLAFSPDGNTLLSGSSDWTARLWDVETGKLRTSLTQHDGRRGSTIATAIFSPDGANIATAGGSGAVGILFWDAATGEKVGNIPGASQCVAFSPIDATLAYARGNSARLWDMQKGQDTLTLQGSSPVRALALSPDGSLIASGDDNGTLRIWDTANGQLKRAWTAHSAGIRSMVLSSDGKLLLSGSTDGTMCLWDVAEGRRKWTRQAHENGVRSLLFVGARSIASSGSEASVKLWSRETGKPFPSPAGGTMQLTSEGSATALAVSSPKGAMDPLLAISADKNIVVRDTENFDVIYTLRGHSAPVSDMAFSADGRLLASVSHDKTAKLWDAQNGQLLRELAVLDRPFNSVAISSNGVIALGWDDLRLVKSDGSKMLHSLREKLYRNTAVPALGTCHALTFSPDGQKLYSGGEDGAVHVWGLNALGSLRPLAEMWPLFTENTAPDATPAYVTLTPQGYYATSPGAESKLRWRRGSKLIDTTEMKDFQAPDKVKKALSNQVALFPSKK